MFQEKSSKEKKNFHLPSAIWTASWKSIPANFRKVQKLETDTREFPESNSGATFPIENKSSANTRLPQKQIFYPS